MPYNPDLSDPVSRLRFQLGDTDEAAELLPNETYEAVLAGSNNDERRSAIALADALINKFAQMPDKVTLEDGMGTVEWKSRLAGWRALAAQLRSELADVTARSRSGFRMLRPRRPGDDERSEYCASGRVPW